MKLVRVLGRLRYWQGWWFKEVEYEVEDEVEDKNGYENDISFGKYVRYESDVKNDDSVGWYVDRIVDADIDRDIGGGL